MRERGVNGLTTFTRVPSILTKVHCLAYIYHLDRGVIECPANDQVDEGHNNIFSNGTFIRMYVH